MISLCPPHTRSLSFSWMQFVSVTMMIFEIQSFLTTAAVFVVTVFLAPEFDANTYCLGVKVNAGFCGFMVKYSKQTHCFFFLNGCTAVLM